MEHNQKKESLLKQDDPSYSSSYPNEVSDILFEDAVCISELVERTARLTQSKIDILITLLHYLTIINVSFYRIFRMES